MVKITNKELYKKIIFELGNKYKIGLHNSTRFTYKFRKKFDESYDINESLITEENIISNILRKGLVVPDKCVGLKSTVTFFDRINKDIFNYSYYQYLGDNRVYVLIVAIPKYVEIEGMRYFISKMIDNVDIINYSLFNTLLPKEFIYGYYIKSVNYKENFINNEICYKCVFDDEMEFYSNNNFYGYMSIDAQKDFWMNYINNFNVDIFLGSSRDFKKRIKLK